jgi:Ca-activated chloride channel homolog
MKIDANDPRWTAFAFGEITEEWEKAELESALEESAELRQLVEETRNTGALLRQELLLEPGIDLTRAQREQIQEKANAGRRWFGLKPAWVMAGATAAVLIFSIITIRQFRQVQTNAPQTPAAAKTPNEPPPLPVQAQQTIEPEKPATPLVKRKPALVQTAQKEAPLAPEPSAAAPAIQAPEAVVAAVPVPLIPVPAPPHIDEKAKLSGTITDASGAVIPGVQVKVTNDSTGASEQAATNAAGQYAFSMPSPGKYSLTAQIPGFQTRAFKEVALNTASPTKLDFNLEIKHLQSAVEIGVPVNSFMPSNINMDGAIPGGVVGSLLSSSGRRPRPLHEFSKGLLLPIQVRPFNTEAYDRIQDNPFLDVVQNALSTFSIDVDTASYSNMRRFLDSGKLPPKDSIRIEELVNYFDYDYQSPKDEKPFAANFELTNAPWHPEHKLLRIGLKGREMNSAKRPLSNLVFLLDVSGSMQDHNKLPLVKQSMAMLLNQLTESDRVAIVVYASATDVWLPSTSGDQREKIRHAIDRLQAGGSTNGASGIQLAYRTAQENFIQGGINRVILATDGDFNVGITNRGDLTRLIEDKAKSGIYLSALGFGMGNLKDATLELLAKNGHGNYAYIDTLNEAKKVLVDQMNSTLIPIAKDVKIQVEFNPRHVSAYRLIGYEDRLMAKEDFSDDSKDAGVIGAGHTVTALYELVPAGMAIPNSSVDPLKYQKPLQPSTAADNSELVTVKIRSKEPEKDRSVLSEFTVKESKRKFSEASEDFKFAAAVAAFGMVLRDSPHKGNANLERALEWAKEGQGTDRYGYRQEFIRLVHRAISLSF